MALERYRKHIRSHAQTLSNAYTPSLFNFKSRRGYVVHTAQLTQQTTNAIVVRRDVPCMMLMFKTFGAGYVALGFIVMMKCKA